MGRGAEWMDGGRVCFVGSDGDGEVNMNGL